MINYKKAKIDFNEIKNIMEKYNDLDNLIIELRKEKTFNITNDFRNSEIDKFIDFNYKSLCVTIKQKDNKLNIEDYVEIWDDNKDLNFEFIDIKSI